MFTILGWTSTFADRTRRCTSLLKEPGNHHFDCMMMHSFAKTHTQATLWQISIFCPKSHQVKKLANKSLISSISSIFRANINIWQLRVILPNFWRVKSILTFLGDFANFLRLCVRFLKVWKSLQNVWKCQMNHFMDSHFWIVWNDFLIP